MQTKITKALFEAYLNCKFKGHLKSLGQEGVKSDYEVLLDESCKQVGVRAIASILGKIGIDSVANDVALTTLVLKRGLPFIFTGNYENESISLQFDGLKRIDGESKLGSFHYVPILFHEAGNARKQQSLLQFYGFILGQLQGRLPTFGLVWRGNECRPIRMPMGPKLNDVQQVLDEIALLIESREPPKLILNDHCPICEFRDQCRSQAHSEDSLSLLRGIRQKDVARYKRKGIFTLTQLAHTFRPRRKGKGQGTSNAHSHALKAMAIMANKVYVHGTAELPTGAVQIYLDFEGLPDESYAYLIGMLVVDGNRSTKRSFWANSKDEEVALFDTFLDELGNFDNFRLFTYGAYERTCLARMKHRIKQRSLFDKAMNSLVNVLSVVYSHIYFPTYSNGLKEVAGFLDFQWTAPDASGIQSIVWRKRWEASGESKWKEMLTIYNEEDCTALKTVSDFVISTSVTLATTDAPTDENDGTIVRVQDLPRWADNRNFGMVNYANPDFSFVNGCSYFDYQRERVFLRTSKTLKRTRPKRRKNARSTLRAAKTFHLIDTNCPSCGGKVVDRIHTGKVGCGFPRRKRAFDLVLTSTGIKRAVYDFSTSVHRCLECGITFVPERHVRLDTHFHGLKSWVAYQHVEHRASLGMLQTMLEEFFGLRLRVYEIHMFKSFMARLYRRTWRLILQKILNGNLIHADETEIKLKGTSGYVWVFTNLEEVVYMYKPNREGGFLRDLLKDFKGVLVSDFYAAYDNLECSQQKCLIHLIRDMNQDLLNNPFDEELRFITQPFGALLRKIVTTIDEHGLKRIHLLRHKKEVCDFYTKLSAMPLRSESSVALQKRLLKNQGKLFTFVDHDGIPWNNNNAEHAVKTFAYYRQIVNGMLGEQGLVDYLQLLSISQTCHYKGVSFLRFLLSGRRDVDTFCRSGRRLPKLPEIQLYPRGFIPPHYKSRERQRTARVEGRLRVTRAEDEVTP